MVMDELKILILEDNEADAEMIQRVLKKTGGHFSFKVVMTDSAYTKALQEFKPDVILSDNALPQFSASEALQLLKQQALRIPFILVTGTVSEEFAAGIIKAGADDYLLKDRMARLPAAIEAALKQKQTEIQKEEAEHKIIKVNRLYFFISQVNQMIVRTTNEKTLFKDACKIAVEVGMFRMAWIGMIEESTQRLLPVMHAGEELDFLAGLNILTMNDSPEGIGPMANEFMKGNYIICNDIETDPRMEPWKEQALSRGYLSAMGIPLTRFGKVVGVFCFYASEKNFFDAEEITLLVEAAGDVSFALEIFGKEVLRKKAEEEVLESERRYQTLAEVSPVGIFHTDADGYTTYVNPRWCQMSGLTPALAEGNGWLNAVHPDDRKRLFEGWEAATNAKTSSVSEYRFVRNDNTVTWVMGQAIPERNTDNVIIGYVGTITDITERKLAEEQIVNEKNLSDKIINSLPGIFYLADQTPRLLRWNGALEEISGYNEAEIEVMTPITLFDPEDHTALRKGLERSYREGMADVEVNLLTKSGKKIPFYFTGVGVEYKGKPAVLGIGIDISERKKAQDEIIKEKNISDSIINSLPGIFYLYDKQGQFLRWNNNFEKVTLYDADEIKHLHPLQLFDEDEKELLTEKISNVFVVGEDNVQANLMIKTKEKIPYYFTGIAIDYEGDKCLMGVGIDFSERKKAQEEIKETSEKLRQLTAHLLNVREEERKRIGREIHDELGQQLTAIKMDVAWIDKKIEPGAELIKTKLKNIITLLDGSNQSIRRILAELRPGILDDYGLIEALEWQNRQFTANTGIPVNFVTAERELKLPEPVSTCIFRIYQEAFTNITRYAHASRVTTSIILETGVIVVIIKDDGIGFDTQAVQSKKSFGVLGMKERVFSLGGTFELETTPGKGTTITIRLPYHI
ncbi:PAS domain S-box protein [Ferruginibacter sp.]